MIPSLLEIDRTFSDQYRSLLDIQRSIKNQLDNYCFDLSKTEITDAIIERMMAFWYFNVHNNKEILDRRINTTAADFFTETCLLFFKSYFERFGFKVLSEEKMDGSMARPDISIWRDNCLIAAIELKVSDGWKGKNMTMHLIEREAQIKQIYPNCYFATIAFWNFFQINTSDWNSKYFGLLEFDKQNNHERTNSSIENLINEIEQHCK